MAWKDLTIGQRSELMGLFLREGISSLSDMRRIYDDRNNQETPDNTFNDTFRNGDRIYGGTENTLANNYPYNTFGLDFNGMLRDR